MKDNTLICFADQATDTSPQIVDWDDSSTVMIDEKTDQKSMAGIVAEPSVTSTKLQE